MNIYLVTRTAERNYDEMVSYVAIAQDEGAARELGTHERGDQAPTVWYAPDTLVIWIGTAAPSVDEGFVVHSDFNAG